MVNVAFFSLEGMSAARTSKIGSMRHSVKSATVGPSESLTEHFREPSKPLNEQNCVPAVLEASRSAHSQLLPENQAQVERAGMHHQPLENVLVPS